jgi:hypothetical protein
MSFSPLFVMMALMSPSWCQPKSEFIFKKVEVIENSKYIKSEFKIENVTGSSLSADFTVLKELNYRITVSLTIKKP